MEFIFFNCKDFSTLDDRIKKIFDKKTILEVTAEGYSGKGANYKNFNVDPTKVQSTPTIYNNTKYEFIDPNEEAPLTEDAWTRYKTLRGMSPDLPQSRAKLEELGILPFEFIDRKEYLRVVLWDDAPDEPQPVCGGEYTDYFYALILDKTNNVVVGRARANPVTPTELENSTGKKSEFKGLPKDIKYMYISRVDINPEYRGQKMCDKLVSFLISKISEAKPDCNHFVILNASGTADGIPACRCYVKSGTAAGFTVHEEQWESQSPDGRWVKTLNEMTLDKCVGTQEGMPDIYFYVKPRKGGKKKEKNKKKNRNKTRKIKSKSKKNKSRKSKTTKNRKH
jgi:hypothetical protein